MTIIEQETIDRFWAKVDKNGPLPAHRPELGPCWVWTAHVGTSGYGQLFLCGKKVSAHRTVFLLTFGRLPNPCALHHCDNRKCVNPAHLFEGTVRDNNVDRDRKGRTVTLMGETHGMAKLTERSVAAIRSARGESQRALAARFGVTRIQIRNVIRKVSWSHV
jgi:hypothetical protein